MKQIKNLNPISLILRLGLLIFLGIELYPILWLLMSSIKQPLEFSANPVYALPESIYIKNFIDAWSVGSMGTFIKNSVICTGCALALIVCLSAPLSFAITKMKWKLSKTVFTLFTMGIMIPVQVMLIPLFFTFNDLGLINTRLGLIIIYTSFGLSMSTFMFTNFFKGVPNEMIEAAVIDGCNIYKVFSMIMIPLIKNAVVTILMIQFINVWNDLIFSMTFISSSDLKTIQSGLLVFTGEYGAREWGPTFASIVMGTLPTFLLYIFLNKVMIEGLTAGAVKG